MTSSDSETESGAASTELPADERKARLDRAIRRRTREGRAEVRSQGEFDAVLVRGEQVQHRLHFVATVFAAGAGALAGRVLFGELAGLALGLVLGVGYALYWLFLAVTGGEELDHLTVDALGVVRSDITGRRAEYRGEFLKVAVPGAVAAYALFLIVGLSHDLVFPPPPSCNTSPPPPNACLLLPNLSDALGGLQPSASPNPSASPSPSVSPNPSASPSPSVSPNPSASPSPTASPDRKTAGVPLSVDDTIVLERVVRGFQLFFSLIAFLAAAWFLRRMLTGRWVLWVRPVRGHGEE